MKLRPGDYIDTVGLSRGHYHAVCCAFVKAGARDDDYPAMEWYEDESAEFIVWGEDGIYYGSPPENARQVMLQDVINTNKYGVEKLK